MPLLLVSLLAFAAFLSLDRWLIPFFEKLEFRSKSVEVTRIGWIAALAFFRRFALTATLTLTGFWLLAQGLSWLGTAFTQVSWLPETMITMLMKVQHGMLALGGWKTSALLGVLGFIWLSLVVRKAQNRVSEEFSRVQSPAPFEGTQTPAMQELERQIQHARSEYFRTIHVPDANLTQYQVKDKYRYLETLRQQIPALEKALEEQHVLSNLASNNASAETTGGKWWDGFTRFFASKGMVRVVSNISGGFSRVGQFLLVLSFLAASKGPLVSVSDDAMYRIADVELQNKSRKLDADWQRQMLELASVSAANDRQDTTAGKQQVEKTQTNKTETPKPDPAAQDQVSTSNAPSNPPPTDGPSNNPPPGPQDSDSWDDEDDKALNFIARQFELGIGKTLAPNNFNFSQGNGFRTRATATRTNILKTYSVSASGSPRSDFSVVEPGGSIPKDAPKTAHDAREFIKIYSNQANIATAEPVTNFGQSYREELRTEFQKPQNRGWWNRLKAAIKPDMTSFRSQATFDEVVGMSIGHAVSAGVDVKGENTFISEIASNLAQRSSNRIIKTLIDYKKKLFRANLVEKPSFAEALAVVVSNTGRSEVYSKSKVTSVSIPTIKQYETALEDFPAFLKFTDVDEATKAGASKILESFDAAGETKYSKNKDVLAGFETFFPGQPDSWTPPVPKKPGGGPRSGAPAISALRARDFDQLHGFHRVGGVLIGREPENQGAQVDFRNITWEERANNELELFLHRADNQRISAGVFPKDLVYQALVYAADGRPMTVTMINALPIPFHKIMIHPALVNTGLGCDAIRLDRLVFKYAKDNAEAAKEGEVYNLEDLLYQYAATVLYNNKEILEVNNSVQDNERALHSAEYLKFLSGVSKFKKNLKPLEQEIEKLWRKGYVSAQAGNFFQDPIRSHLAAKPDCYHPRVVSMLRQCLKSCDGSFATCSELLWQEMVDVQHDDLFPADNHQVSGVREMPYSIDTELSFLRPGPNQNPDLFPLDFIRQIVSKPKSSDENEPQEAPWMFPQQASGLLTRMVSEGIKKYPADGSALEQFRNFTLLQRLFKISLDGGFGHFFPVEKLSELATATRSAVQESETPAWDFTYDGERRIREQLPAAQVNPYQQLYQKLNVDAVRHQMDCLEPNGTY